MRAGLDSALNDILHQMDAGKSLEQCLEGYAPETAEELRALVEMATALQTLRSAPPPQADARAANRQRFLEHAAAIREAVAPPAAPGFWQRFRSLFSRPTWREAMYAASLTLVLGLLMLVGVAHSMNWWQLSGETTPSRTEIVQVDETRVLPTVKPSVAPSPALSPAQTLTPEAIGTRSAQAAPDTPTPTRILEATPTKEPTATQEMASPIIVSPSPTQAVATPTPTATKQPATSTSTPTGAAVTVIAPPTATATPTVQPATATPTITPTPVLPTATFTWTVAPATATSTPMPPPTATPTWTDEPPDPTNTPEQPTATFTSAPPTNTPTLRPTLPPTPVETTHPEPTLVLTIVPAVQPTVTPPR